MSDVIDFREKPQNKCMMCPKTDDLRPYGPGGGLICFGCASSSPELMKLAELKFSGQLQGCGEVAIIDSRENIGPVPIQLPEAMTTEERMERVGIVMSEIETAMEMALQGAPLDTGTLDMITFTIVMKHVGDWLEGMRKDRPAEEMLDKMGSFLAPRLKEVVEHAVVLKKSET